MNILNLFRRNSENAKIEFGNRGEDIIYRHGDKELYVEFTILNGYRIYPISLQVWKNGSILTELEKEKVFTDVINFVRKKRGKPIIVINRHDPNKSQWESLSSINLSIIEKIEHA